MLSVMSCMMSSIMQAFPARQKPCERVGINEELGKQGQERENNNNNNNEKQGRGQAHRSHRSIASDQAQDAGKIHLGFGT